MLIQKDVKHHSQSLRRYFRLRALLIQKDVKLKVSPSRRQGFESFVNSERCKT